MQGPTVDLRVGFLDEVLKNTIRTGFQKGLSIEKVLEKENAQLKKRVADLSLDNPILKEASSGNSTPVTFCSQLATITTWSG